MKTRCPACGAENSLDALIAHDEARQALWSLAQIGGEMTMSVLRYLSLFRPSKSALSFNRVAVLLGELLIDMQRGQIQRHGQMFDVSVEIWTAALQTVVSRRESLTLPLKSHGYLYEILSQMAVKGVQTANELLIKNNGQVSKQEQSKTLQAAAMLERLKR